MAKKVVTPTRKRAQVILSGYAPTGLILKPKRYEWASISRKNIRDLSDWVSLCPSCHRKYDINKLTIGELYEQIN